ncbi:MAG: hypothetical protein ACFFCZ_29470 [Promethearchaeota archaeon]
MKRSHLTVILTMISIILVFVSFFFTSQLAPYAEAMIFVMGIFYFLFASIGIFFAYREKTAEGWDPCTCGDSFYSSARMFLLFGVLILLGILIVFFTPIGLIFEMEGIPPPITLTYSQNLIFIVLWVVSSILLILATALYEDQETKRWI